MPNPYFTRANPDYLFGFRGVPPLPLLLQYFNRFIWSYEDRHRIGIIGGWCWLSIHWSRGSWGATKSFPTTCLLGVVAKNAGICWNRMTLFISLFTIKTANLKTSGFVEKPRVFFHIQRFCRFLSFKVYIYIYIYLHIHIHICIYVYVFFWLEPRP